MPGAVAVVTEGERLGEAAHRLVGMLVIDRIDEVAGCGSKSAGRRMRHRSFGRRSGWLVASQRSSVLEVLGVNVGWIGTFHAAASLYPPASWSPGVGPSKKPVSPIASPRSGFVQPSGAANGG